MVFSKSMIYLSDTFDIKIPEETLIRLEDGLRANREMLLTINASHYGMRNKNWTVYRHDTVKYDIPTFVSPEPKPVIEKHKPKTSKVFGHVIAADYKLTSYHPKLNDSFGVDDLSTEDYIELCKRRILPMQDSDQAYNGLAYVQVVTKLNDEIGIKKVLEREFLRVSIGARPKRLICSECGQDQTLKMCEHFGVRDADKFMLAEALEYEELSFVPKGADPFAKVIRIHDGVQSEYIVNDEAQIIQAEIGAMYLKDFFNETADDKTIVCMNNICTVINREDSVMKKEKRTVTLQQEFGEDKVKAITDSFEGVVGSLELPEDLTDRQFALVQKTPEGAKRRFPLNDELNVRLGLKLLKDAEDLSETEREKVTVTLKRAAKKLGIEITDEEATEAATTVEDTEVTTEDAPAEGESTETATEIADEEASESTEEKRTIEAIIDELKDAIAAIEAPEEAEESEQTENLEDNYSTEVSQGVKVHTDPIEKIFDLLKWLSNDIKWAGESLNTNLTSYIVDLGKGILSKDELVEAEENKAKLTDAEQEVIALKEELAIKDEEIALLDKQNTELNYQLRGAMVDEIIATRAALNLLEDSEETEKIKFLKFNYDALVTFVADTRKLKMKLNDSPVNNNLEITTIANPTHADSDEEDALGLEDEVSTDAEKTRELTFKEKVALMKSIARRTLR